jgi:predicted transcriptional regulator
MADICSIVNSSNFSGKELLSCMFSLSPIESEVFVKINKKPLTVLDLSKAIKRDRSTTQRILKSLTDRELVYREAEPNKKGGHYYLYKTTNSKKVKEMISERIEKLTSRLNQTLKEL